MIKNAAVIITTPFTILNIFHLISLLALSFPVTPLVDSQNAFRIIRITAKVNHINTIHCTKGSRFSLIWSNVLVILFVAPNAWDCTFRLSSNLVSIIPYGSDLFLTFLKISSGSLPKDHRFWLVARRIVSIVKQ